MVARVLEFVSLAERPDLKGLFDSVVGSAWRHLPFMGYAAGDDAFCDATDARPEFQLGVVEPATGRVLGVGNSAPIPDFGAVESLPEGGWDWQANAAKGLVDEGGTGTWLAAFSISVMPSARGRGVARRLIEAFRERASNAGLRGVVAPVRPVLKAIYPVTDMADYLDWKAADGGPFDPWIRTHAGVGGRVLKPCRRSMTVEAPAARWEAWTGVQMPAAGSYVLPGCLAPVALESDHGIARYVEPNVWVVHG